MTEVTIPASLTTVDDTGDYGPFSYCDYLTSAVIAEGAKTVPSYLFMNCTSLKKVTIASTVKSVDRYAFHNCSNLESVHFEGTQDAWNIVTIGNYNESLKRAKITFGNKVPANSSTQNTTGNTNGTSNNKNNNENNNKNNKTTNTSAAAPGRVQLKTVKAGKKKATIYWNATAGADGYIIYRSTKKKSGYKSVKTIANGSKTKWTNKKLSRGRKYYFKVKAYKMVNGNMILSDSFSAVKSVKVK